MSGTPCCPEGTSSGYFLGAAQVPDVAALASPASDCLPFTTSARTRSASVTPPEASSSVVPRIARAPTTATVRFAFRRRAGAFLVAMGGGSAAWMPASTVRG